MAEPAQTPAWNATRFFDLLQDLGPLRVISVCGPSVFEAICEAGDYEVQGGSINMITPVYHWHFAYGRFAYLRSHDTIHKRSGRQVFFFELREEGEESPFLRIYLYRPPGEQFSAVAVDHFQRAHAELGDGVSLSPGV